MTPQAVILDIGNVLIEWNPERFYDAQLGQAERRRFMAETQIHAMNLEVDRGADLLAAATQLAQDHPAWAKQIMQWHDRWIEFATPEIAHSVRLMHALRRRGVPVFALSNFGASTFQIACRTYPFLQEFDRSYISAHLGLIKPDPQIYAWVERDCGIAPEALLFSDDRPENIEAAKSRGWQAHLFDGPEGWAHTLVKAGLLSEKDAK